MGCEADSFANDLAELGSAEEFLEYFEIPFDARVVHVNRLHILQRFHDYLARQTPNLPPGDDAQRSIYRLWLERAYKDFEASDALTEKVFAVFQHVAKPDGGMSSFVSLDKVFRT